MSHTRSPAPDNKGRQEQYEERSRRALWMGAGLLGLITLVGGDLSGRVLQEAPGCLVGATVTLLLLTGLALAFARISFDTEAREIARKPPNGAAGAWPRGAQNWYGASLLLFPLSGVAFVTAFWIGSV